MMWKTIGIYKISLYTIFAGMYSSSIGPTVRSFTLIVVVHFYNIMEINVFLISELSLWHSNQLILWFEDL